MALTLHKTSKHTRVYRGELPNGDKVGYSKTSITPMHYETVLGSGDYDCPIDLKVQPVTNAKLDGYEMTNAGYHFRLQTAPAKGRQKPQGTVSFGGRQGQHWFHFRLSNVGYIHWPTRDLTDLGGKPDYSAAPTFSERTRNLGTHKEVSDELVVVNTMIRWHDIWTMPGGGEVYLQWGLKGGKMKEEIVVNQAARGWLGANPPATSVDETYFGFRFEIDASDIPKLWRNGVEQDTADGDFDDDEGNGLALTNALDELLAFMPLDDVYVGRKGGRRPLRKRFYKAKDKNYLLVAVKLSDLAGLLPGDLKFDPSMTQEQVSTGADDCQQFTDVYVHPSPYAGTPAAINRFPAVINAVTLGAARYDYNYLGYYSWSEWMAGFRFTPDVPAGSTFTGIGPQYATLRCYQDQTYPPLLPIEIQIVGDIKAADQPSFANDFVNSPAPGSANWQDGLSVQTQVLTTTPGIGSQFEDIDVAAAFTEIVQQPSWAPNNGARFAVRISAKDINPARTSFVGAYFWAEAYADIAASAAVLDAFYVISTADRKPGFYDEDGGRNKRKSRLLRNATASRFTGSPDNNRNRHRFNDMP